ncbi:hypothetical protein CXB51_019240 [Gossypium anomalum]|uniref:Integrase catalytic domain-containing protein n=1 Tax=Gossypium anomalum TaxID=47600 RepID=A0A8J6CV87_9ROSI|nr:hypothetical protein CXB51_019240 [Gossypium anomalum]
MNEIDKTLPQLFSMLRTTEGNMKKVRPKPVLMIHNNKGKGKAKVQTKPKGKGKPKPGKGKAALKPKGGVSKEGNYFHCGVIGHWKRNCPIYLEEIKKAKTSGTSASGIYVIDINLSTTTSWVLDTGCGSHICTFVQGLQRSRTLARGDVDLRVRNGARVAALAARGGFHYFITFTDDFSRYEYVYLICHKLEALEKFKEFKNEVQNQLGKTIKTLRSDRGGEYSSLEFDDLLEKCGIVLQLTPPGTPQWNGGHALETTAFTLNRVPSKSVQKTPYKMWTGKRPSMSFMKIWVYEAYVKCQTPTKLEPKFERCIFVGYPKETKGYYFFNPIKNKIFVARTGIFLEREFVSRKGSVRKIELEKIRESQDTTELEIEQQQIPQEIEEQVTTVEIQLPRRSLRELYTPERYGFLITTHGNIFLLDQDEPRTYQEAVTSPGSEKWLEAMRSEMDSMYENQVWTLIDPPEGVKPIGCKWVFKKKTDMDAMFKSIRILLAIVVFHDYEIWQMGIKTAFLNGKLEEDVYMTQPKGFVNPKDARKICKLQRSIYRLKQASRIWNLRFNNAIKEFGFIKNEDEPCVYKKVSGGTITFLVLYVDDILIMGNDIPTLQSIKTWLGSCFSMKDLGEATYILGVKIYRDRSRRLLGLSQSTYIDKVLKRFNMKESKRGFLPMRHGISLSKEMCPSTPQEREHTSKIPYASAIGSIMYAMLCTHPDVSYNLSMTNRYQVDPGEGHWTTVKNILKYLRRTKDMFLIYGGFVFCLNDGAMSWKSSKQSTVADSTTEAEYIVVSETVKEAAWIKKFIIELGVVPSISHAIELRCDDNGAIAQAKNLDLTSDPNIYLGVTILFERLSIEGM